MISILRRSLDRSFLRFYFIGFHCSHLSDDDVIDANLKPSVQTFYIFVIREHDSQRYFNDYLILPSSVVRQYVDVGIIKDGTSLSLRIQKDNRGRYILNAKQDVTISINTFGQLA